MFIYVHGIISTSDNQGKVAKQLTIHFFQSDLQKQNKQKNSKLIWLFAPQGIYNVRNVTV